MQIRSRNDVWYLDQVESGNGGLLRGEVVEEGSNGDKLAFVFDAEVGLKVCWWGLERGFRARQMADVRRGRGEVDVADVEGRQVAGGRRYGIVRKGLVVGHGGLHVDAG